MLVSLDLVEVHGFLVSHCFSALKRLHFCLSYCSLECLFCSDPSEILENYQVKDKSSGVIYIVAESRLSSLPSRKTKPSAGNSAAQESSKSKGAANGKFENKGTVDDKVKSGLDTETYELLEKITGASLVGKK